MSALINHNMKCTSFVFIYTVEQKIQILLCMIGKKPVRVLQASPFQMQQASVQEIKQTNYLYVTQLNEKEKTHKWFQDFFFNNTNTD